MLKDKLLSEVFPPAEINKNSKLIDIQLKSSEEDFEVLNARRNLYRSEIHDLGFEVRQELAKELVQELYDKARMAIEEARKVIELYNLCEHHELCEHNRKLIHRGTIVIGYEKRR